MRLFVIATLLIGGCAKGQATPEIRDIPGQPVVSTADPVNQRVAASTVDGLMVVVTISGDTVRLDSATPARVPAARRDSAGGDRVTATGFAGGIQISQVSVPDGVVNVQEGVGLVRVTRRQVVLPLPAPRPLDTVEIRAPATGATARLDVRPAYAAYCEGPRRDPRMCPS